MNKLWNWLKRLFKKSKETEEVVIEEAVTEEDNIRCENCEENDSKTPELVIECPDLVKEYFNHINWEYLTVENIEWLNTIDLNIYSGCVNWYRVSKFKGLPDDFIRKYKDKIIWNEYNKCYLKKATKEMLKAEGYF